MNIACRCWWPSTGCTVCGGSPSPIVGTITNNDLDGHGHNEQERCCPVLLPPSLEVSPAVRESKLCTVSRSFTDVPELSPFAAWGALHAADASCLLCPKGLRRVTMLALLQAVRFETKDLHEVDLRLRRGRMVGPTSNSGEEAQVSDDLRTNSQPQQLCPDALILEVCGPIHFVAAYTLPYCPGANPKPAGSWHLTEKQSYAAGRMQHGRDLLQDGPVWNINQTLKRCSSSCSFAGVGMLGFEGCGTRLPLGFINQTLKRCSSSCSFAGVGMLGFEGCGTRLPLGFTELRAETNSLRCSVHVEEQPPHPGSAAADHCIKDPVHFLCRVVRLALVRYSRFELAAEQQDEPLQLVSSLYLYRGCKSDLHDGYAIFDSIDELAVAMQQYAAAEGLKLRVASNKQSIRLSRSARRCPACAWE